MFEINLGDNGLMYRFWYLLLILIQVKISRFSLWSFLVDLIKCASVLEVNRLRLIWERILTTCSPQTRSGVAMVLGVLALLRTISSMISYDKKTHR